MSVMEREISERPRRTCAENFVGEIKTLEELQLNLHRAFDSDHINVELINEIMESYKSNPQDWRKYAKFDRYRYTRNLVDEGNGNFNLMLLCWGEGHGSAVHDHADAHCFMKVLEGTLSEVRFAWPENEETQLKELSRTLLRTNEVCYINDSQGLHRVENTSHVTPSISLHLYCPPFKACHSYNERSGHRTKCNVTFWSRFGERTTKTENNNPPPEDN